jgi:hypothetical protein
VGILVSPLFAVAAFVVAALKAGCGAAANLAAGHLQFHPGCAAAAILSRWHETIPTLSDC